VRAERQISELSATLLPGHPRMRQLKADLAGLKKQLDGEVGKIVDGLDKEAKVAALREESINRSLAEIKERIVTASPDEVKLRQLENDARSKRAELERLQTQFEANRVSDDTRTVPVEVQIITQAGVSSVPVFPKKGAFTALVMTATFLFGLVGIITRALLAGARRPSTGALVQGATYNGVERRAQPSPEPVRMADAASVSAPPVQPAAQPAVARSAARSEQQSVVDAHEPLGGAAPAAALVISAGEPQLAPKGSIGEIAARLDRAAKRGTGFRTLVTGETAGIEPGAEALSLGKMLAASGKSVIIVDWSTSGAGLAGELGIAARPGLSELIDGRATFEDIVQRVPGGEVHAIASGPSAATSTGEVDADRVNLILDALDEAYDHIIIVGPYDDAHHLFEAIEGRFDAGLLVATEERQLPAVADEASSSMFLGFEVSDIMIVRYERPPSPSQPGAVPIQRLLRATGKHAAREGATASVPAS
jgi:Mrp family chromosome partitioning ATPase